MLDLYQYLKTEENIIKNYKLINYYYYFLLVVAQ